ncbi:MAG: hypothetical protein ABJC61_00680 [Acidobacteriota bacterium]
MSAAHVRPVSLRKRTERLAVLLADLVIATLCVLAGCASARGAGAAGVSRQPALSGAMREPARTATPPLPAS